MNDEEVCSPTFQLACVYENQMHNSPNKSEKKKNFQLPITTTICTSSNINMYIMIMT